MKHTDIYEVLRDKTLLGKSVTVCGWVRTFRDSAQVAFLVLADGKSFARLQVVFDKNTLSPDAECLKNGAAVCVRGEVVNAFKGEGCELNAEQVTLLGACPPEYPIQKKRTTLEFLRSVPHLRLRTNTFTAAFRVRSVAAQAVHRYFHERRYYYINTPLITASDCEGAGEMFRVTTQPFDAKYSSETEYYKNDFFGRAFGFGSARRRGCRNGVFQNLYVRTFLPRGKFQHDQTPCGVLAYRTRGGVRGAFRRHGNRGRNDKVRHFRRADGMRR